MKSLNTTSKTLRYWQVATVVLMLALIGVSLHAYVFWDHEEHIKEQISQYPLIDPARHLISQDDYISTLQPLRERVHAFAAAEKGITMSVYIEFLNTGANISVNQEERYWPASLAKVPVAMAVMGAIERGIWTRDQLLTLEEADRSQAPSTIHENPVGTPFTVEKLLEELLIRSDNTAFMILLRNVPQSELDAVREGLGLNELFNRDGEVTAREYSRIFRALYTASYLSREDSQYLLSVLDRAEWDYFLSGPVPTTTPFPHKYGLDPQKHTYSDSGIGYVPNRPYLITVMIRADGTEDEPTETAQIKRVMNALSVMSMQYFTNAANKTSLSL